MSSLRTLPIYQSPIQTQPTASQYKSSLYNIFVEKETEVYAFNSRSVALSRLTKREYAAVRRMLDGDMDTGGNPELESLRQGLIKGQFLIPQTLDEIEMLKVKNRLTRFSSGGLGLIIAPTLRCNFACEYCYVDLNANKMDAESRARVKKFFDYKLNPNSAVSVVWTGGDPSLAMDVVEEISSYFAKKCEEKNSKYDTYL
ncbi:MAG: radical SAM protein, partial [Blastocatellia bacterium]